MDTPPPYPAPAQKSGLSIASLVLGILSLVCFSLLAGIPAIICGHVARAKIKKSGGRLTGAGMALAGLIMGYVSLLFLPIMAALAIPAVTTAAQMAQATQLMSNGRQFAIVEEAASKDRASNPQVGYPADAKLTSADQLSQMLVSGGYLMAVDLETLGFDKFEFGNVSAQDPDNTIVVRSKPDPSSRYQVVILKSGDGKIISLNRQETFGVLPPRTPEFLD